MTTPIERANAALEAAEIEVARLESALHDLARERSAARTAGDEGRFTKLNNEVGSTNVALRTARADVENARSTVVQARKLLEGTRNRTAGLSRQEHRLAKELAEAVERVQQLTPQLQQVQQDLVAARSALAALEPAVTPIAPQTPKPKPPRRPKDEGMPYQQPARVVSLRGQAPRYYNKAGQEVDRNGQLLPNQTPEPAVKPESKRDPHAPQTAPSLWD
jgi:hypothetical protein